MQKDNSIFREVPEYISQESVKIVSEEEGFQEVEQFLCESAFVGSIYLNTMSGNLKDQNESQPSETPWRQDHNHKAPTEVPKNSIFHNFQKHLITIIKKLVNLSKESLTGWESQDLVLQLWSAFLKTKSHSKKIFHIIFGVPEETRADQELQRLARIFGEFKKVKENYDLDAIREAQQLLRNKVVQRLISCDKCDIIKSTHVHKIDEFYEYVKSFAFQLSQGPSAKRMTKARKTSVIKQLKKQQRNL